LSAAGSAAAVAVAGAGWGMGAALLTLLAAACAALLWTNHRLRGTASRCAAAEARLIEVFRQIPASAAIIEAPNGRRMMRSLQSDRVIGDPETVMEDWRDLSTYGGLHPDGRPFAPDEYPIVRALRTGEVVGGERFLYRRPDGAVVDLEVHAGPVRDPAGRIVAAVGMAFDVSERVRAERELLESEARCRAVSERLRAAIDAGALGLWEYETTTGQFHVDARMAAMLGLPAEPREMPCEALQLFIEPSDRPQASARFQAAGGEGGLYADEIRILAAGGEPRWLLTRGIDMADLGKVVGVVTDVTERRQREEALKAALDARDVLMREADHRIKNSLQMVGGLLRLQMSRVADRDAKDALAEAIGRVNAVANAHLALQRSPDLKSVGIDAMLGDLCSRAGALNPSVSVAAAARCGLTLDAERAIPLGLIVSEVLTNALRHAYAPGEPGEVSLVARQEAGALVVTISDGGVGMPAASTRAGLGSTVIAALARQIGATLISASEPGLGTAVTLRLDQSATTLDLSAREAAL
jgi:two-component sensor histidine kinase/PAS domain-containing protein